jgi:hypothetical protein
MNEYLNQLSETAGLNTELSNTVASLMAKKEQVPKAVGDALIGFGGQSITEPSKRLLQSVYKGVTGRELESFDPADIANKQLGRLNKQMKALSDNLADKKNELMGKVEDMKDQAQQMIEQGKGTVQDTLEKVGHLIPEEREGQQITSTEPQAAEDIAPIVERHGQNFLNSDHMEEINQQVKQETEAFRNNLVPQGEQDEFDLQGQKIYNGAQGIMDKMALEEEGSARHRVLGKVLNKSKKDMEAVMDAKEEATGTRQLTINRQPTQDEYKQIEEFQANRREELIKQKQIELNPEQDTAPEQVTKPTINTAGEQAADISIDKSIEETKPLTTTGENIAEDVAKKGAEKFGEEITEEIAAAPELSEFIVPLTALGTGLGLLLHKTRVNTPAEVNPSTQFGT